MVIFGVRQERSYIAADGMSFTHNLVPQGGAGGKSPAGKPGGGAAEEEEAPPEDIEEEEDDVPEDDDYYQVGPGCRATPDKRVRQCPAMARPAPKAKPALGVSMFAPRHGHTFAWRCTCSCALQNEQFDDDEGYLDDYDDGGGGDDAYF